MTVKAGQISPETRLEVELKRLIAESDKFRAEQTKSIAEAAKLERERWFSPVVVAASVAAAMGSVAVSVVSHLIK